ncbi:MAG: PD-(D/E)XK motif protein [Dehalococcoidia bacterium]
MTGTLMLEEGIWRAMESEVPPGSGVLRRRIREESARNLFLGIAHPGRERFLALVVGTAAASDLQLPSTGALRTFVETDPDDHAELRIVLTVPEMSGVFTSFCEDVSAAVAAVDSDERAVAVLVERFAFWRRLFTGDEPGLSALEAQALYGELWVLQHLVLPHLGHRTVDAWRGPIHEDRDFLFNALALEVKTTRGDEPTAVTITNEAQLDLAGLDRLYLVALKLDLLRGGRGDTLNSTVAAIREALEPIAAVEFRDKLLRYGYLDQQFERYTDTAYVIREVAIFRVEEGFPRIIERDLLPGVGSVTYRLALSACEKWRSSPAQLEEALVAAAGVQD